MSCQEVVQEGPLNHHEGGFLLRRTQRADSSVRGYQVQQEPEFRNMAPKGDRGWTKAGALTSRNPTFCSCKGGWGYYLLSSPHPIIPHSPSFWILGPQDTGCHPSPCPCITLSALLLFLTVVSHRKCQLIFSRNSFQPSNTRRNHYPLSCPQCPQ